MYVCVEAEPPNRPEIQSYMSVEAVSALQHTHVLLGHVIVTYDTRVLHVQLYSKHQHTSINTNNPLQQGVKNPYFSLLLENS